MDLKKRTFVYLQRPRAYEMSGCSCGNHNPEWSEFEKHLWCSKCELDFIPKQEGVFNTPIPMGAARMLGLTFSRLQLETNVIEVLDKNHEYMPCLQIDSSFNFNAIPVSIKQLDKVVASGKLDSQSLHLTAEAFDTKNMLSTTEIIFNYPAKDTFVLYWDSELKVYDNEQLKLFNQYILHQRLGQELSEVDTVNPSVKI